MRWLVVTGAVLMLTSGCAALCDNDNPCPDGMSCKGATPDIPAENPFQSSKSGKSGICDCPDGLCGEENLGNVGSGGAGGGGVGGGQ